MDRKQFFTQLGLVSIGVAVLLFLQGTIPELAEYENIAWGLWLFYLFFCILTYFAAYQAALSPNLNSFTSVVLGVISGKMFLTIMILVVYSEIKAPSNALFAVPFIVIYLIFTVFEMYFLTKLGRIKK